LVGLVAVPPVVRFVLSVALVPIVRVLAGVPRLAAGVSRADLQAPKHDRRRIVAANGCNHQHQDRAYAAQ
jgi:hypothetical protein